MSDWTSDIRELYEVQKLTLTEIGRIKQKSRQAVHQRLQQMGVDMGRYSILEETIEEVKRLALHGDENGQPMTMAAISEKLGVTIHKVSKILKEKDIKQILDGKKSRKRENIVNDYLSGLTSGQVANLYAVSESTVKNYVLACGHQMRPKGKFKRTQAMRDKQSNTMRNKVRGQSNAPDTSQNPTNQG